MKTQKKVLYSTQTMYIELKIKSGNDYFVKPIISKLSDEQIVKKYKKYQILEIKRFFNV